MKEKRTKRKCSVLYPYRLVGSFLAAVLFGALGAANATAETLASRPLGVSEPGTCLLLGAGLILLSVACKFSAKLKG